MIELDKIDKAILEVLQISSKVNMKEIAAKVGLTVTPTYERVKKLEQTGIIKAYTVVLDNEKLGKSLEVFCHVSLSSHSKKILEQFEKEILEVEEVLECYHVTGNSDYMLKLLVKDISEYRNFIINKLSAIDNVANVQSSFVMTNVKPKGVLKF